MMLPVGERIEDLLPSENSWNSGLVAITIGIFFQILVFIVKKVGKVDIHYSLANLPLGELLD